MEKAKTKMAPVVTTDPVRKLAQKPDSKRTVKYGIEPKPDSKPR